MFHLHATHGRKVVALGIEEQRVEHRLGGVERRRLARAHDAVDVEQRLLARRVLVDRERGPDVGADVDVIDVEHRQFVEAVVEQARQGLGRDLVAGLGEDLAGLGTEEILGEVLAVEVLVAGAQRLDPLLGQEPGRAGRHLLAGLDRDLAGVGVDQVDGGLHALQAIRVERHAPAVGRVLVDDRVVEGRQDLLAVHAEGEEQRRDRDLPAPVDAGVDDVLGVELDVEPGAAIRDDAGREQQLARRVALALVVVEEDARRPVHLRDDDALGAVDDEGAVRCHERHVAHVDVLLLDVLDGLRAGVGVHIEHDQAQRHFERRSEGHAAGAALVDIELRLFELVLDEFEQRRAGEVRHREHGLEDRLQPLVGAAALRRVDQQELVVGGLLHLDQVRHFRDFADVTEEFADPLPARERLRHVAPRTSSGAANTPDRPSGIACPEARCPTARFAEISAGAASSARPRLSGSGEPHLVRLAVRCGREPVPGWPGPSKSAPKRRKGPGEAPRDLTINR